MLHFVFYNPFVRKGRRVIILSSEISNCDLATDENHDDSNMDKSDEWHMTTKTPIIESSLHNLSVIMPCYTWRPNHHISSLLHIKTESLYAMDTSACISSFLGMLPFAGEEKELSSYTQHCEIGSEIPESHTRNG
jgi:hypothetical protein